jgi:hypothetical protein
VLLQGPPHDIVKRKRIKLENLAKKSLVRSKRTTPSVYRRVGAGNFCFTPGQTEKT